VHTDPTTSVETDRERTPARSLAWTLALVAVGALGAAPIDPPGPRTGADPLFALVWIALCAPTLGALAARLRLPPWPYGFAVPGAWGVILVMAASTSPRVVPTPLWAAAAWVGLFALGASVAQFSKSARTPYAIALASTAASCAAWLPGALGSLWPPSVARILLDLSPVSFVVECAGLDWMRQEFVYSTVQTDRFERHAWSGALAGPTCLLVGYAAWAAAWFLARHRRATVA